MPKYSSFHGTNFNKIAIRKRILNSCQHLVNRLEIVTYSLPNKYFSEFEEEILRNFDVSEMFCFEKDVTVFAEMNKSEKAIFVNKNILSITNRYMDICWLDLMCSLTPQTEEKLRKFVANNTIREDGILSITLCNFFRTNREYPDDYMENSFSSEFLKFLPKNSQLIDYQKYYNSKSWMYNYIFKINN